MSKPNQAPVNEAELSRDSLILSGLQGKTKAIAGYDNILWKIRAGYVGILYGSLAIILGTGGIKDLQALVNETSLVLVVFLLLSGFSISAYIVDSTYLAKKLKVIVVRDLLVKLTLDTTAETDWHLSTLLSISGELPDQELPPLALADFKRKFAVNRRRELFPIYVTPPVLILCIFLIVYFAR